MLLLNVPLYSASYYKFVCQLFAAEQVVYSDFFFVLEVLICKQLFAAANAVRVVKEEKNNLILKTC